MPTEETQPVVVQKISVTLECAKETYELGQGLQKFVAAVRAALADGWSMGEDLTPIMTSALGDLLPAIQGAEKIGSEMKGDVQAFADGLYMGIRGIAFQFVGK